MRTPLVLSMAALSACSPAERPFPLQAPLLQDTDLASVRAPCHEDAAPPGPDHLVCAPEPYVSPHLWDETDSLVFRPLSEGLGLVTSGESIDVNSLDEVPDSSWFTNRLGARPMSVDEVRRGRCDASLLLDPDSAADGTWVIDKGKTGGNTPGFRVSIPGKGKYLFKVDDAAQPEQSTAASVIGAAAYHAVGFDTTCEQIVYFKPSLLKLMPGLRYKWTSFGDEHDFDRTALDALLRRVPHRGGTVRMLASAWLPGRLIGPFRYEGMRADDPNDVVPHEDRRELRASGVLAAWVGHTDSHEFNSVDRWLPDRQGDDTSPGHVVHTLLDWGDCLGNDWPQEEVTRRMGYSYIFDWGDMASDFATLGARSRPWEDGRVPGHELFGYFDVAHFVPDEWKNEYPNPAFSRMTERDAAWMARILARFTPDMIRAVAEAGRFSDPRNTEYLVQVLQGRLDRILDRYLTRLSSVTDLRIDGKDHLCGVDLAERIHLRDAASFRYSAHDDHGLALGVDRREAGGICVELPRAVGDRRYVVLSLSDGVSASPLHAHLYALGTDRGYYLAGITR
jgi:hypothetical protein